MKYKGYTAVIEVDEESGLLFGHVIGLRDGINFQGETITELRMSFAESVDCYLEFCAARNKTPEKPFSGKFMVRIAPALHRSLVERSSARGLSLNALVERTLAAEFAGEESEARLRVAKNAPKAAAKSKSKVKPSSKAKAKVASKAAATPATS